jgi:hypothetical protein
MPNNEPGFEAPAHAAVHEGSEQDSREGFQQYFANRASESRRGTAMRLLREGKGFLALSALINRRESNLEHPTTKDELQVRIDRYLDNYLGRYMSSALIDIRDAKSSNQERVSLSISELSDEWRHTKRISSRRNANI